MNTRALLQIATTEYVMFLAPNQMSQARLQKKLKPELKGATVEKKSYPKEFAVELGKLYRQDALARGIYMPVSNRLPDPKVTRLTEDREKFLTLMREARTLMETSGLTKIMPFSYQRILDILKQNA